MKEYILILGLFTLLFWTNCQAGAAEPASQDQKGSESDRESGPEIYRLPSPPQSLNPSKRPSGLRPEAERTARELLGRISKPHKDLKTEAQILRRTLDIQTDLPVVRPVRESEPALGPDFLRGLLKVVFVVVVGLISVIIFWSIWQHVRKSRKEKKEDNVPESAPLVRTLDRIYEESLALAKKGRYAEAIHQLLLKSLEEFQKRQKTFFPRHLTSREILAKLQLGPPVEPALAFMVQKTEISIFGLYEPTEKDFSDCRDSYEALLKGLGRRLT
ncbi:MAG: hypothetical protein LBP22_03760 [Deltaproteobacteria bacterium]|jgi:hypothetical protein|nr:hypothetical protein [Deltaproteobacteria bacterium]